MRCRRAALAAAVVLCGSLTACTDEDGSDKPNVPDTSPSSIAPPPQEPLTAPEVEDGYEEIFSEGPHRGVQRFGTIELPKGEFWINVNCISRSKPVELDLSRRHAPSPVGRLQRAFRSGRPRSP